MQGGVVCGAVSSLPSGALLVPHDVLFASSLRQHWPCMCRRVADCTPWNVLRGNVSSKLPAAGRGGAVVQDHSLTWNALELVLLTVDCAVPMSLRRVHHSAQAGAGKSSKNKTRRKLSDGRYRTKSLHFGSSPRNSFRWDVAEIWELASR